MESNIGDLTGQTFGTCTLVKTLGQGGMGAVYLARQTRPSRNVAVKILHPSYVVDDLLYREFLVRFEREADVIARLEHVNIMPIYEYGEQNNIPYLVIPYLAGGSLRDLLAKNGPLSLTDATRYIEQAASGLDYAHSHGIIHRDLKPANFLLHGDGRLVLADFGIARIIDNSDSGVMALTHTGTIIGTPDYMAPEMAQGDPIDYRADIYELGVVLYQMLTGHLPFIGNSPYTIIIQHIQKNLPLIHVSNPNIPPAVDDVLQKATAKRPAERFTSAGAMAQALRKAIQQIPSQSQPPAQQQTLHSNLPTSTPPIQPPEASYQAMQQQAPAPVAPPIIARQAPIKIPENVPLPEAIARQAPIKIPENVPLPEVEVHSVSTIMHNLPQPAPYQVAPQKRVDTKRKSSKWILLIVALIILIGGGILAATLLHGSIQGNKNTTNTPVPQYSPTVNTQASLTKGAALYNTTTPACDTSVWQEYKGSFDCYQTPPHIQGGTGSNQLGGIFLHQLPNGQTYPTDYVVEAHIQSIQPSAFGIYFRDQPGNTPGTYAFLVSPDGTWQANVYDNQTGQPRQLKSGTQTIGSTNTGITLAVVVKGQNFSFYINDKLVGTTQDNTYSGGIVGIAVDHDGEISSDQFSLYPTVP